MMRRSYGSPESNQRYWRRRANRRVRKARLTRTLARWVILILLNLVVAAVLLRIGGGAFSRFVKSEEFSLARIEIVGAERSSAETVRSALAQILGRNIFELDLRKIGTIAKQDRWVRSASVKRVLPDKIRIKLSERTPCVQALIGGMAYLVDTSGFVIGQTGVGTADDLPVLTGLSGLEAEELIGALRRGVDLLAELSLTSEQFTQLISELDIRRKDRIVVSTIDPGPRLLLDPGRVGRNIPRYLALRDEIGRRIGPLEYVDLRWQDHISVKPPANAKGGEGR